MTNAYIYIRYSDPKQKLGSSYERQIQRAKAYCIKEKLNFRDEFVFLGDGVSAFKNEHLATGEKLKELYDMIDDGTIPAGSYLLVENMDRLSRRDYMEAGQKFLDLTNRGIVIVTLMNERKYQKGAGIGDTITALVEMDVGHIESAKKSERVAQSWTVRSKRAREGERIKLPLASWLTYHATDANQYALVPDKAKIVRQIFQWCNDGYGVVSIAGMLNQQEATPFRGERWTSASVYSVLKNSAVIGTYTPNKNKSKQDRAAPVADYFPSVIDESMFFQAQAAISERKNNRATRQGRVFNVWAGIAKCSRCGGAMHCVPKGRNSLRYLVCSNKAAKKCNDAKNIRNADSEIAFRELLVKVDSLSLIDDDKAGAEKVIRELDGRIEDQRQRHNDYGKAMKARWTQQLDDLAFEAGEKLKALEDEREVARANLVQEQIKQSDKAWFLEKVDLESYAGRSKANALLKRLGITVRVNGGSTPLFVASNGIKEIKLPIPDEMRETGDPEYFVRHMHNSILQIMLYKGEPVLVPLNDEQRQKFREQDSDGRDSERLDDWLIETLGVGTKEAKARHRKKTE